MSVEVETITLCKAEYVSGYKLRLFFENGKVRVIDFAPFLRRARNPMSTKYLDVSEFKKFTLRDGNLDWNDMEMCFPVADLYDGEL
ncbi:MAG: DUF2442 domain-containing protein [Acidobacteriota bacterium]|nr:DUF2442 domain-containing protein [Acidobacteriota bacterium]